MSASNTTIYINEIRETAVVDGGDPTLYTLYGSDVKGVADGFTAPVVYVNGILQLPTAYTVDYTDGEITFLVAPSGTITCTYTWEFAAADSEDANVYAWEEPTNMTSAVDVNGYRQITEPINSTQPWTGTLAWEYVDTDFYNMLRHIYKTAGCTFDISLDSLPSNNPVKDLTTLKIMTGPKWEGIPGVPCKVNLSIMCMQLES